MTPNHLVTLTSTVPATYRCGKRKLLLKQGTSLIRAVVMVSSLNDIAKRREIPTHPTLATIFWHVNGVVAGKLAWSSVTTKLHPIYRTLENVDSDLSNKDSAYCPSYIKMCTKVPMK